MPNQETVLTVVVIAISVNLALALAILVSRLRARSADRRAEHDRADAASARELRSFATVQPAQRQTDAQTGLELSPTWERWLTEEDARVKRYHRPATIVIVEIEGLERLAERLGSAAADRLIPPVAVTLRRHARQSDRIARLGRARFGAILVETGEVEAINYIERIRSAADLWLASGAVALRLSIGWAEANTSRGTGRAVEAAEERLNGERRRDDGDADARRPGPGLPEPALG